MYARATVPMVDCKGSENWIDVPFSLYLSERFFTSLCLWELMPCTWCQQRPEGTLDPLELQSVQVEVTWLSPGNWTPILQKRTKQQSPTPPAPIWSLNFSLFAVKCNASEDEQCVIISPGWGNGLVGNMLVIQGKDLSSDPSTNLKAGNGTCAYSHSTGKTQTEISPEPTGWPA